MVSIPPRPIDSGISRKPTGRVIFVMQRRWFRARMVPKIEMERICTRRLFPASDDRPREVTEFYLRDVTEIDMQTGAFLYEPAPEKGVHSNG